MEFTKIALLLSIVLMFGCHANEVNQQAENITSAKVSHPTTAVCGAMPPIRDKSKIADNLRKQGLITASMNQQEIDQVVADYISKRQKQFAKCPKPLTHKPSDN
ncbi:hypothetical protein [Shewanella glacialimarina]|jgi:hypothetical protein|uniref:hypothetical protein n=1 Tax=Shewanella glacialimarina TaxID=2590884 RepID=UPI001CF845A1|nr:hypothetical protein [Shewanella glacialimarina]UCX03095.1 hypothetical protein FJ709_00260 [Shewanella glacialimarina]